jgi:hypothetical protein
MKKLSACNAVLARPVSSDDADRETGIALDAMAHVLRFVALNSIKPI